MVINAWDFVWGQVVGESRKKEEYLCFPQHYCSCYSFFYDVVNRGEELCVSFTFTCSIFPSSLWC